MQRDLLRVCLSSPTAGPRVLPYFRHCSHDEELDTSPETKLRRSLCAKPDHHYNGLVLNQTLLTTRESTFRPEVARLKSSKLVRYVPAETRHPFRGVLLTVVPWINRGGSSTGKVLGRKCAHASKGFRCSNSKLRGCTLWGQRGLQKKYGASSTYVSMCTERVEGVPCIRERIKDWKTAIYLTPISRP